MQNVLPEQPELTKSHLKFLWQLSEMGDGPAALFSSLKAALSLLVEHGFVEVLREGRTYKITFAGRKILEDPAYADILAEIAEQSKIGRNIKFNKIIGCDRQLMQAAWTKLEEIGSDGSFASSSSKFYCLRGGLEGGIPHDHFQICITSPDEDIELTSIILTKKDDGITILQIATEHGLGEDIAGAQLSADEINIFLRNFINSDLNEGILSSVERIRHQLQ